MSSITLSPGREPVTHALRPRRFWQGVVGLMLLMTVVSVWLMALGRIPLNLATLLVGSLDLAGTLALAGYAWRRPVRSLGLQLLLFLLAVVDFLRLGFVVLVMWPSVVPWRGDALAWQALWTLAAMPLLAMVAIGLFRYATEGDPAR